jgi:Domain of unknown function (DUF4326)
MTAQILNLHETSGKTPDGAIRICRPGKWGNPYPVGHIFTRDQAIAKYREHLDKKLEEDPFFFEPLRNHDLACWCFPEACHGDVILEWLETHPAP